MVSHWNSYKIWFETIFYNYLMYKNHVNGKIKCIFEIDIVQNGKDRQTVVAGEHLTESFSKCLKNHVLRPTIKLDGTSCYVAKFNGKSWLYARHDVKPNKMVSRKYKQYQKNYGLKKEGFVWNLETDYNFPKNWIAAHNNPFDGSMCSKPIPAENGHLVGWVPVDPSVRTHLWHLSAVDLIGGFFLCLNENAEDESLIARIALLDDYLGATFELIGTKVNGNPYDIGTSNFPVHFYVQHGELSLKNPPEISKKELSNWFVQQKDGLVEGIVWHGPDGNMFKIHRHHLGLPWPVKNLPFSNRTVYIDCNGYACAENVLLNKIVIYSGKTFDKIKNLFNDEPYNFS
ncbi:RNA ligase 1 isoform X1 [Hydra vulgaris]|uniref:RNA ligase 1 isoform X1 n=1 Tax=Hydra vulgaris TaxID=6087 RepID=UPI001F5E5DC2|nr:uncharacterized protein C12orf29 homolog [Hydra vulgaris]